MKKQFVTYEISLKLKELGFNEECFGIYCQHGDLKNISLFTENNPDKVSKRPSFKLICNAPLWQQVIDWLREKHDIIVKDDTSKNMLCSYNVLEDYFQWAVIKVDGNRTTDALKYTFMEGKSFNSYYEAREQAILKAIELCKKN